MGKYKQNKMVHQIRIETVPNGYTMDVDGTGYHFFTVPALIEGFLLHVGLGIVDYCEDNTMRDLITACATWPKEGDAIQAAAEQQKTIDLLDQAQKRTERSIKQIKATNVKLADELIKTKKRLSYYIAAEEEAKKKAKAEAKKAEKGETDEKPKSTMIHKADIQVNVPKKIIKVKPGPPIDKPAKVERRGRPPKQAPKNDDHEELEKRLREKGVLK